jgi:nitrate reductase gamma subunit
VCQAGSAGGFARALLNHSTAQVVIARMPGFQPHSIWYLSVVAVYVQLALTMLLLRREFDRRLRWAPVEAAGQRAIA